MPMMPIEELLPLPGAAELLDLRDGEAREFRVLAYEQWRAEIATRDGRPRHAVNVLRVHVPASDKPTVPSYWDITSKTLITGLLADLEARGPGKVYYKITKHGTSYGARFSVETRPVTTVA